MTGEPLGGSYSKPATVEAPRIARRAATGGAAFRRDWPART